MLELTYANFHVVDPLFAETEINQNPKVLVKIGIYWFAGIIVVLEKTANLRNAFRLSIFGETKAVTNRRSMFFVANVMSPVHSWLDYKFIISG
ncbi:uncharacterized protein NPIL_455231 [Nephila pilipes]|uniref:Uncharacterized protein n=1 Tax=Nephila pilipes TaxID=299642 RepID=A0A8X6Q950_NEPPI|nr:uncharacterized protein NPIL_455231 [Nephila pilipes]